LLITVTIIMEKSGSSSAQLGSKLAFATTAGKAHNQAQTGKRGTE
jgi:hypothetical protein